MILDDPSKFPNLPPDVPLIVDVETTSFDDNQAALRPFNGHRVAGYAFCTLDGKDAWYLPIRHRNDPTENCDFCKAQQFIASLLGSGRNIVNHNIKFDMRFWHQDGLSVKGNVSDTMALARLCDNDLFSYSLASLSGGKKLDLPHSYCKEKGTKDYGRVPVAIMARYAATDENSDVRLTAKLYSQLLQKLPDSSKGVWDIEVRLTKQLARSEISGIPVDQAALKEEYIRSLRRMVEIQGTISVQVGRQVDLNRQADLNWLLMEKLGIKAKSFTKTGRPQWNATTLKATNDPTCSMVAEYSHLVHFSGTYCQGWLERLGDDGLLHPNFRQAGTRTGRMSCGDPNFQNVPAEAEIFVTPFPGDVILGWDFSQIEYRVFAHYANDQRIIDMYSKDRTTDFHQGLANLLGVDRQFAKSLNFAFLYGMGKQKLLRLIAGICALKAEDLNMKEKLRSFLSGGGGASADKAAALNIDEFTDIATNIYDQYHRQVPTIRQLQRRVADAIVGRGWLRNFMGRVYRIDQKGIHRGVNYLIQGSCADIFKERLATVMEKFPDLKLLTNVHDACYFSVKREIAEELFRQVDPVLTDVSGLRVPLMVEGKASSKNWGTVVKVKDGDVSSALAASETKEGREWGKTA